MAPATVREVLLQAARDIAGESARADAELLLADAMGTSRTWLVAHDDALVDAAPRARFNATVARRRDGEPVALVLGRQDFWSLSLELGTSTLVPRPDTERLVELALERLPPGATADVLDLGTGSGAIALAIASERPAARVTATDASHDALAIARGNAVRMGLGIRFLQGDWFAPLYGERFDLVLSNPPYLADDDPHLRALRHEPRAALVSGPTGIEALAAICAAAPAHLRAGGWLLLEHGNTQGARVRALLHAAGFAGVGTWKDIEGRDRASGGQWTSTGD